MLYDYIVIGAGMGGLSVANFLARAGKRVLVLDKHDKPGGLITSFKRRGLQFDIGIEGLHELADNDAIQQFFEFWGGHVPYEERDENIRAYIDGKVYDFHQDSLTEDFYKQFPEDQADLEKLFKVHEKIYDEMHSGKGAPKHPMR